MADLQDEDAVLMLRTQRGDTAAFELLVERYRQPVINFVQRTLQDPDEAEDIAQQVFVQAWKAAARYRVASKFSTWLFTIARNLCLNELRRRGRHPTESLDEPIVTTEGEREKGAGLADLRGPGLEGEVLLGELTTKVEEALADLPESQRSAILLFREKELAYEDIAVVLGVSVSATKSIMHRARETLRRRLKSYLRTGEWSVGEAEAARETFPRPRV